MKRIIVFVCLCMFTFSYASAEGYQVNAQSAKQVGMGHVGVAMKLGAESMHFNPAGLGFLQKNVDLSLGVSGVMANATCTHDGVKYESDNKMSTPIYAYAGFKIYDFLSAGISVNNPYGSSMDWGKNWPGAYLVQDISLKAFSIQPTVAWKIMDRLSVGAGLMVMFGDFSLSRALISSDNLTTMGQLIPALKPLADKYQGITPVSATLSGDAGVKMGYNVGAMFDINEQFTVGASYRSKVMMRVDEGNAVVNYAGSELSQVLASQVPQLDQATFEAELPLPSNFNIGLSYKPTNRWLVSGEVQFVGWGAYKELDVTFYQQAVKSYDIKAEKNYQNTRIYRLGAQFAATNRLDLRMGTYFDESPVKDDFLNPETPSMNKLGLSAGLSFRPAEGFSIDLSCNYVTGFGRDGSYTDINPVGEQPRTFTGHYEVYAIMPSIGLSYSF